MTRKRLIVNADGYGFTPGVNRGIIETFDAGFVRSTSCTPNFGYLEDVGEVAGRYPNVSFGIHFNLSVGPPVCPVAQVPSLVNEEGQFWGEALVGKLLARKLRPGEIEAELTAQAALLADSGVRISHFDGHQNKHLYPTFFETALKVADKLGIRGIRSHNRLLYLRSGPVSSAIAIRYYLSHPQRFLTHSLGRWRTSQARRRGKLAANRLITPGYVDTSHKSQSDFWRELPTSLPAGDSEVYCHPAYPDDLLRAHAKYVEPRAMEREILSDPSLVAHYEAAGVELINFHDLSGD